MTNQSRLHSKFWMMKNNQVGNNNFQVKYRASNSQETKKW